MDQSINRVDNTMAGLGQYVENLASLEGLAPDAWPSFMASTWSQSTSELAGLSHHDLTVTDGS